MGEHLCEAAQRGGAKVALLPTIPSGTLQADDGATAQTRTVGRMLHFLRVLLGTVLVNVCCLAQAHPPGHPAHRHLADREPNQQLIAAEEAFVHTLAGFEQPGKPLAVHPSDAPTAMLHVRIVDASSDQLTAARVNIVGPQGNFYEPRQNADCMESSTDGP